MPRLVSCGSRKDAFDDFVAELSKSGATRYVGLWIDSEDPLKELEQTWAHLAARDGWRKPVGAADEQVLFMTTCMETLIVADRAALKSHYGSQLQESTLPPLDDLENRSRKDFQDGLYKATRYCSNAYAKGKRSFEILAKLDPDILQEHLPSFKRTRRILDVKLA